MKKLLELISDEVKKAFGEAGYEEELGKVTVSNRPDLCEYQCNGAMAGAKKYHKAPIMIAKEVAEKLQESAIFSGVEAVAPGFLNRRRGAGARKEDRGGLRRAQCSEAPSCRASAFRDHRRKRKADLPLCGSGGCRRYPSGRLGAADGADHL